MSRRIEIRSSPETWRGKQVSFSSIHLPHSNFPFSDSSPGQSLCLRKWPLLLLSLL